MEHAMVTVSPAAKECNPDRDEGNDPEPFFFFFFFFFRGVGSLSQPRLNIFTVDNMGIMICLGQGGLRSLSASSFSCNRQQTKGMRDYERKVLAKSFSTCDCSRTNAGTDIWTVEKFHTAFQTINTLCLEFKHLYPSPFLQ